MYKEAEKQSESGSVSKLSWPSAVFHIFSLY